jgi:hypothetical protein
MPKRKIVEDIDFSSHQFLVNDLNNNLFEWMEKGRKEKCRKQKYEVRMKM